MDGETSRVLDEAARGAEVRAARLAMEYVEMALQHGHSALQGLRYTAARLCCGYLSLEGAMEVYKNLFDESEQLPGLHLDNGENLDMKLRETLNVVRDLVIFELTRKLPRKNRDLFTKAVGSILQAFLGKADLKHCSQFMHSYHATVGHLLPHEAFESQNKKDFNRGGWQHPTGKKGKKSKVQGSSSLTSATSASSSGTEGAAPYMSFDGKYWDLSSGEERIILGGWLYGDDRLDEPIALHFEDGMCHDKISGGVGARQPNGAVQWTAMGQSRLWIFMEGL